MTTDTIEDLDLSMQNISIPDFVHFMLKLTSKLETRDSILVNSLGFRKVASILFEQLVYLYMLHEWKQL